MKPTLKQVQEWHVQAIKYADEATDQPLSWVNIANMKYAELAAQWGAEQAQQATPEGFVRVPLVMTQAMEEVTQQEDWQWADLLAAAEAVTEEQYNMVQAQQTTEPELTEAVAEVHLKKTGGNVDIATVIYEIEDLMRERLQPGSKLFTAAQMHEHYAAGVRAGMARGQSLQTLQRGLNKVLADPEKHGLDLGDQK